MQAGVNMGLLQNIALLNAEPLTYYGAGGSGSPVVVASTQCMDLARYDFRHGKEFNFFYSFGSALDPSNNSQLQKSGMPYGYAPPYQFVLAIKGGALLTRTEIAGAGSMIARIIKGGNIASGVPRIKGIGAIVANVFLGYYMKALAPKITGEGTITAGLAQGINLALDPLLGEGTVEADMGYLAGLIAILEGVSSVEANINLPIGMSTNITGQGDVVANLVGLALLLAALEGEGTVDADFKAMAQLACGLDGEGDLVNPTLNAIAWCVANILGEGEVDGASNLRGDSYMEANITVSGDVVTAQSCAAAVWNALAAAYNDPGTMGKAMNSASSSGDPWESLLANYTDDATFGAFVKKLLTTGKFIGLK